MLITKTTLFFFFFLTFLTFKDRCSGFWCFNSSNSNRLRYVSQSFSFSLSSSNYYLQGVLLRALILSQTMSCWLDSLKSRWLARHINKESIWPVQCMQISLFAYLSFCDRVVSIMGVVSNLWMTTQHWLVNRKSRRQTRNAITQTTSAIAQSLSECSELVRHITKACVNSSDRCTFIQPEVWVQHTFSPLGHIKSWNAEHNNDMPLHKAIRLSTFLLDAICYVANTATYSESSNSDLQKHQTLDELLIRA